MAKNTQVEKLVQSVSYFHLIFSPDSAGCYMENIVEINKPNGSETNVKSCLNSIRTLVSEVVGPDCGGTIVLVPVVGRLSTKSTVREEHSLSHTWHSRAEYYSSGTLTAEMGILTGKVTAGKETASWKVVMPENPENINGQRTPFLKLLESYPGRTCEY